MRKITSALITFCFLFTPLAGQVSAQMTAAEPVYVVIMNHVEGDRFCRPDDAACLKSLEYQTAPLPEPGTRAGLSYSVDGAGNDLIYNILMNYSDSAVRKPRLFIEPAGEWWQTYANHVYGGKFFDRYNYLVLGNEFGIQGHPLIYSGIGFGWYESPHTEQGVFMKFRDLHHFAQQALFNGRRVNGGKTFTGGWKTEHEALGDARAEYVIDHAAHALGYRISFEDHNGHIQNEPAGLDNLHASPFVYQADYGDGVKMIKIDMNGSVTTRCAGNLPGCERPEEAVLRFDRTVDLRAHDANPNKVYFFAFAVHSGEVWNDFHMAQSGHPLEGEGLGLKVIMDHIQARIGQGAKVKFVTPSELATIFETRNTTPSYFLAVHNEPNVPYFDYAYQALTKLIGKANEYHMKLTLMFTPQWANYITSDETRAAELESWKTQGHEIAGHHHSVWHAYEWDGFTYMSPLDAKTIRNRMGKDEPYLGNLVDFVSVLSALNPNIHSGCMNDEKDKNEIPPSVLFDTCSGFANFGTPGTLMPDSLTEKGRNDYVSAAPVNGTVRKWLTHAHVMTDDEANAAIQFYAAMPRGVYGAVTHSVDSQADALIKFMDFLHQRDPRGEHSKTVSQVIGSGLLPEMPLNP